MTMAEEIILQAVLLKPMSWYISVNTVFTLQHSGEMQAITILRPVINLYITNYDGKGGKFGDTSVKCETSDIEVSSAYASIVGEDDSKLHIILLNKNYDQPTTFNFSIGQQQELHNRKCMGI